MRKVLIAVAIVLILIAGGLFALLSNLDSLIAKGIEKGGSEVMQTSVSVKGVELALSEGRLSIAGLEVGNPEGFSSGSALSLGDITVDMDIESMRGEPVIVETIRVTKPLVNAELNSDGSLNIEELRKTVEAYVPPALSRGSEGSSAKEEKRLRILRFVFEEGRIALDASALGLEARSLDLPAIKLENIGGPEGARPGEIAQAALSALTQQAMREIGRSELKSQLEDRLDGAVDEAARGLLDKLGG